MRFGANTELKSQITTGSNCIMASLGHRPQDCKLIISSNISQPTDAIRVNYASLLGNVDIVADNPALMMRLLIKIGVRDIFTAGLDGFSAAAEDNYYDAGLALGTSIRLKMQKNSLIRNEMKLLREHANIRFLTQSKYDIRRKEQG